MATQSEQNDALVFSLEDGSKVTLGELKSGYMKNADYIQKSERNAADRRELNSLRDMYQTAMTQLRQQQRAMVEFTQGLIPEEPDVELAKSDPSKYRDRVDLRNRAIQEVRQLMRQAAVTRRQQQQTDLGHYARLKETEDFILKSKMPRLCDPAKFEEFEKNVHDMALELGLTKRAISAAMCDHRLRMMLYYAHLGKLAGKIPAQANLFAADDYPSHDKLATKTTVEQDAERK